MNKKQVEILINENKVDVKEIYHVIKGKSTKTNIIKYKIGISIKPYVEKHILKYDENSQQALPKEFYTDVTYDTSIKALAIELSAYNVICYERLSDLFM